MAIVFANTQIHQHSVTMTLFDTIILSIVEGITEFLPISSTGHMIIVDAIMNNNENMSESERAFTRLFEICIQLGAILSVVVLYWRKFFDLKRIDLYFKLVVAVFPALVFGFLFSDKIDELLESPFTVGVALFVGGIVLLFIDRLFKGEGLSDDSELNYKRSFMIGMWQVLAMIPGTSRSAATIIGGMQQGLTRKFAAEFSFFLAVPTMMAATGYKLLKAWQDTPELLTDSHNLAMLGLGNVIAFVVALIAIKTFISFLQKNSLRAFGVYRIVAALVIFSLMYAGKIAG